VKSVSFYLERFQRYGMLNNVQPFWATMYFIRLTADVAVSRDVGLLCASRQSIRMTEDRDKWRKYVHGVANPRIEDG